MSEMIDNTSALTKIDKNPYLAKVIKMTGNVAIYAAIVVPISSSKNPSNGTSGLREIIPSVAKTDN